MKLKPFYLPLFCLILMNLMEVYGQDSSIPTQKEGNKTGQWKGLVIDQSTPDDAKRILGKPDKESDMRLAGTFYIPKWISTGRKDEKVQTLEYKKVKDFKRVTLQFESNKLVSIYLWFDDTLKLTPAQVAANYGIQFFPLLRIFEDLSPDQFVQQHKQRIEQGIITPLKFEFGTLYPAIGVTADTFVVCLFSPGILNNAGSTVSFPGIATSVILVSRHLEKKQKEVDALK